MKTSFRVVSLFLLLSIVAGCAAAQETPVRITAMNSLPEARTGETIEIPWKDVAVVAPSIKPTAVHVLDEEANRIVTSQIVDLNGDGSALTLVFQSDFRPVQTKHFLLGLNPADRVADRAVTDARFMTPREDVAWENDRNAYRIYGPALAKDVKNGIDVWCKRVRYPIIEKWYKGDEDTGNARISYHEDHGEGADFFDVGKTLGAGGDAIVDGDSLIQPGVFATHRIIAAGPIRAMFETTYPPVKFKGDSVTETRRITLDAGSNLNKVEVSYRSSKSYRTYTPFASGLVKRKGVTVTSDAAGCWAALWGPTNAKDDNGSLGTGIVMPRGSFTGISETAVHVLVRGAVMAETPATYYAGACWSRSGDMKTSDEWNAYLAGYARRIASPLSITIEAVK